MGQGNMKDFEKAEKNDEALAEMEDELLAELESDEEETEVDPSDEEKTSEVESAPETKETPEETEEKPESEATDAEETEFSEEEMKLLSEKTGKEMASLRDRLRKAQSELDELSSAKEEKEVRKEIYSPLEETAKEMAEAPYEGVEPKVSQGGNLPWEEGSKDITVEDYQKHVAEAASKVVDQKLERERGLSLLAQDAKYLESNYELLDPDSEDFDKDLTKKIYSDFKRMFAANPSPSTRLKDFAEPYVKRFKKVRAEKVQEKKEELEKKVSKQKASQAVTSTAPKAPAPSISERIGEARSIEELEKLERQI